MGDGYLLWGTLSLRGDRGARQQERPPFGLPGIQRVVPSTCKLVQLVRDERS